MREKRRAIHGYAKHKRDRDEPGEFAASACLGDDSGQGRACVDGKGAEKARHQIGRANAGKIAVYRGAISNRNESARR